ncbi:hypothetical protein M0R72_02510 [Candidatus Pacearchaeota archaeon]|jgi:hypothetical protein|nr:hypothetical protein [Candidatus Pacearchaeota archaeon]
MIKKVIFFNTYHNGDIHVSRSLVGAISDICAKRNIPCEYCHGNGSSLLADIKNLTHVPNRYGLHAHFPSSIVGNVLFINTWYCADMNNFQKYNLTFDCLYMNFKESAKWLDIDLDTISGIELFPNINFEHFAIGKAKEWLGSRSRPLVFVSNGSALSGQATNFSFSEIIHKLAQEYDYIDFLISNTEANYKPMPNTFMTSDIIQKVGCDLNENAYLAGHCSLILGRCSGAYSFAVNRQNYWDNPKTFLAFTTLKPSEAIWTHQFTPPVLAKIISHDVSDHRVIDLIREHLPSKF